MNNSKANRNTLHKVKIVILLPLTIFLWMVGWTLYCIGEQRMTSGTAQHKKVKSEANNSPANPNINHGVSFQKQ